MLKETIKELGLEIADHWKTKAVIRGSEHVHNYYTFKIGEMYWCASEAPIINNQYSYVLSREDNPFEMKYAGYDLNELKEILKGIISREEKTC